MEKNDKKNSHDIESIAEYYSRMKYKICVSGAAETNHCGENALEASAEMGREIVRHNGILLTGATTGIPFWAAKGAKEAGGISVGFSPASNEKEHVEVYKLPLDFMDLIVYTGFGYPGRDLLLTRSSDAVICGCGRIGTIHEFTIAFEDNKAIGILKGRWEMDEELEDILRKGHRRSDNIVSGEDPKELIEKVIEIVNRTKTKDS